MTMVTASGNGDNEQLQVMVEDWPIIRLVEANGGGSR